MKQLVVRFVCIFVIHLVLWLKMGLGDCGGQSTFAVGDGVEHGLTFARRGDGLVDRTGRRGIVHERRLEGAHGELLERLQFG